MLELQILFVFLILFWSWGIVDVIATAGADVRALPKIAWFAVSLVPGIGAIAWLLLGRPEGRGFWPGHAGGIAPPAAQPAPRSPREPGAPRPPRGPRAARSREQLGPYGENAAPRYQEDLHITDRRSAELDRQLDEWQARQRDTDQ